MIPRISKKRLKKLGGRMPFSSISKKPTPIKKVNAEATKKRRARNAKRMRGVEYQTARRGAMERADGQCEYRERRESKWSLSAGGAEVLGVPVGTEATYVSYHRCPETERLQFHEERYARGRILTKDDGKIYCFAHHRLAEKQKPHKQHRSGF